MATQAPMKPTTDPDPHQSSPWRPIEAADECVADHPGLSTAVTFAAGLLVGVGVGALLAGSRDERFARTMSDTARDYGQRLFDTLQEAARSSATAVKNATP